MRRADGHLGRCRGRPPGPVPVQAHERVSASNTLSMAIRIAFCSALGWQQFATPGKPRRRFSRLIYPRYQAYFDLVLPPFQRISTNQMMPLSNNVYVALFLLFILVRSMRFLRFLETSFAFPEILNSGALNSIPHQFTCIQRNAGKFSFQSSSTPHATRYCCKRHQFRLGGHEGAPPR